VGGLEAVAPAGATGKADVQIKSGSLAWAGESSRAVPGCTVDSCNNVAHIRSFDIYGYLSITPSAAESLSGTVIPPAIYLNMQAGTTGPMTPIECLPRCAQPNINLVNYLLVVDPRRTKGSARWTGCSSRIIHHQQRRYPGIVRRRG
jgi:hypothetical protein